MLAMVGLVFLVLNLISIIWLYIYIFHVLYLVGEMTLGQAAHSSVHMISCLNCTVQLTDTIIVNNLKGSSRLPAHILLLEVCVMGKIRKLFSYVILPFEAYPCDLVEVHVKTMEIA